IIAFIREYLIRGFMTSDMVEEVLGISVISNIQEVDEKIMQKEAGTILLHEYIRHKPLSSFAESIRKIRVQAEGVHATTGEGQSVLVTSSVPNEGKTEIATSYAASAANAGNNVVVVDCDFRNPSVAKLFGVDVAQGLGEYLMGSVDLRDLIHKNVRENIDFIGINQIPKSPSDTLKTGKLQKLLDELKQRYQFVIMDTPPLAPVVDTAVIANCVDHIVYVTAWETTPRDVVKSTIKTLDKSKEKIAGIVLNRIDPKRESKYGYYYGYALKNYAKYYDA
ncbi:MAG: CpsD/CapB family tyrosine-protein kinase, partial [Pseudomonadota bacterium]